MKFKEFLENSNKNYTIVYHVSPRSDIFRFRPTGSRKGTRAYIGKSQSGIFVAPKFRDAVAWATTYVSGKKLETQKPNARLREKMTGGGNHGEKGVKPYKNLTIYEIKVPKEILKGAVYTRWWEPEYFISEEHLDKMEIVKSKTYSVNELVQIYERSSTHRSMNLYPEEQSYIVKASKTNFAAKAYLELIEMYNNSLMAGKKPKFLTPTTIKGTDHLIRQKIDTLKNYIFNTAKFNIETIKKLNKVEEIEVKKIYEQIKSLIEKL